MTVITAERSYFKKSPALIAANVWLANKLKEVNADTTLTDAERRLGVYRFSPIDIDKIWVEYARPTTSNNGNCLLCFGIRSRGFAVLDAVAKLITFANIISTYKIPVKKFNTYAELFTYVKKNKSFVLYQVAESKDKKYGLLDDTTLPQPERYKSFLTALGDVQMDTVVSYQDLATSASNPVVGTIALSHGSMTPITLELYSYQDILAIK